jgi:hypothetical protein
MTSSAICAAGGASATHGDLAVTSKNTDPDSCTAERTSDNASVLIGGTPRRTMPRHVLTTEARAQGGRARTIAGLDVRARGPAGRSFSAGGDRHKGHAKVARDVRFNALASSMRRNSELQGELS